MRRRKFAAGLAMLATTAALAGCGGSSSSGVTPAAYVKAICATIGPFEKDVQARSSSLNLSSLTNAAQGKKALQTFMAGIVADTDKAVTQLKAAGTPDVSNGKQIATTLVGAFTALKVALAQAATKAGSLPTSSPQAFQTAAQALGTSVQSSMSSIGSSLNGLKSADLEKAAANDPTCKSLSSGG